MQRFPEFAPDNPGMTIPDPIPELRVELEDLAGARAIVVISSRERRGGRFELQQRAVAILDDMATRPFAFRGHLGGATIGEVELNRSGIEHDELRLAARHMSGEIAREWLCHRIGGAGALRRTAVSHP